MDLCLFYNKNSLNNAWFHFKTTFLTLAVVRGAGVTPPPVGPPPPPTPGPGDLLEEVGPDSEVLELDAGAYSEWVWGG